MSDTPLAAPSPLLSSPGAVPPLDGSPDAGVAWHYGDPFAEQRAAVRAAAVVDRSHRFVIAISGEERLTWLHTISSQHVASLPDGTSAENLSLDLNGRVEHHFVMTDIDGITWIDTEAGRGADLLGFLQKMVFWSKAEPRDGNELAVLSLLGPDVAASPAFTEASAPVLPGSPNTSPSSPAAPNPQSRPFSASPASPKPRTSSSSAWRWVATPAANG